MAAPSQDERMVPSSQAKLDELFLHWLSLPESQEFVTTLLSNARKGRPILDVATQGGSPVGDTRSPPGVRSGVASPPPRSPTAGRPVKQSTDAVGPISKDSMWLDAKPDASPPGGSRGASGVVSLVQETAHAWPAAAMDAASSSAAQPHAPAAMQTAPALSAASGSSPQPLPQAAAATSKDAAAAAAPAHHGADTEMAEMQPPAGRSVARGKGGKGAPAGLAPVPGSAADLPKFYTPAKLPEALVEAQAKERQALQELFAGAPAVAKKDFHAFAVAVCGFPSFFAPSLFDKIAAEVAGKDAAPPETLVRGACEAWYAANCKDCRAEKRLLNLLRSPGANHVTRADWKRHLTALLDTHAGLDFLKGTTEFQERYLECVIERIYYVNDRADSSKLTLADLARSNLVRVLHYVDQEPDINKVMDYFSYEHFYVLYCKFWELDADHDFLLDREDVVKLCNYALTYRIVDRIFAGACRPLHSGVPDRVGYQDFIWLLLSEEDKTSETAIRYWFRGIDLDGDGYITPHEMEFFYKEQLHRMDCLAQEVVQFEDILCQMTDMVKPEREGFISMMDLKRCRQAGVFFNVLFNLTKFIQYDQKDPGQIFNERATPELTDWGRYAKLEYARLAMEEDQGEYGEEEAWEMEQDAEQPTGES